MDASNIKSAKLWNNNKATEEWAEEKMDAQWLLTGLTGDQVQKTSPSKIPLAQKLHNNPNPPPPKRSANYYTWNYSEKSLRNVFD